MATIRNYPAMGPLDGSELLLGDQAGTKMVSVDELSGFALGSISDRLSKSLSANVIDCGPWDPDAPVTASGKWGVNATRTVLPGAPRSEFAAASLLPFETVIDEYGRPWFGDDAGTPGGNRGGDNSTLGSVFLDDMGGVPDYIVSAGTWTTDNTVAFNRCLTRLGPTGGTIWIRGAYFIGSDIEIPTNVTVRAVALNLGGFEPAQALAQSSGLWHPSTTNIVLDDSARLKDIVIGRAGLLFNQSSSYVASTFAGNGIQWKANSSDQTLDNVIFLGFAWAGFPQTITTDLSVTYGRLNFLGRISGDCLNGFRCHNQTDLPKYNGLHFWPFTTVYSPSEVNGAQLKRSGWALLLTGNNDHAMALQCFNYGYKNGFEVIDGANTTWFNCDSDYPYQSTDDGSFGFRTSGFATETRWIACQAVQRDSAFITNPTITTSNAVLLHSQAIGCDAWENRNNTHAVKTGRTKIIGGTSRSSFAGANGIQTANDASVDVFFEGHHFANLARATVNGSTAIPLREGKGNTYANIQNQDPHLNKYLPQIASASTLAPNATDHNYLLTGTTSVGTINLAASLTAEILTFYVVSGVTFMVSGNISTKTGANTAVPAGQMISFFSDGTTWRQI